jgi:hypothetical protein
VDELTPLALLGKAFYFTLDDLRANRTGKLSPPQRRRLMARAAGAIAVGLLLLLAPMTVGLGLVWWGTEAKPVDVLFDSAALAGYLTGLVCFGFYLFSNFQSFLLPLELVRGRIQSVSGPVKRHGLYLFVKKKRFLLDRAALDLIQDGLQYTFHFLPLSRQILSVEFAE